MMQADRRLPTTIACTEKKKSTKQDHIWLPYIIDEEALADTLFVVLDLDRPSSESSLIDDTSISS